MLAIRKKLFPDEGAPPDTRVNPETGDVETTSDGGETWTPNPDADPRLNPAYQVPPNTEPDPKCAAAAGMVENVRRTLDNVSPGATIAGIATAALGFLLIPGIGWMWAAMLIFAGAILAAGVIATQEAFTEEVYDWLLCAFYDQLDGDGRITEAGLETVIDLAVAEQPDALVNGYLRMLVNLHHFVGFNNAGVAYADAEATCPCGWCYAWFGADNDGGFVPYVLSGTAGTYVTATGWQSVDVSSWGGHDRTLLMGSFPFSTALDLDTIDIHYNFHKATSSADTEGVGVYVNDFANSLFSVTQAAADEGDDLSVNINSGIPSGITTLDIWMQPAIDAFGGEATLTIVQITGQGDPPTFLEAMGWVAC